MSKEVEIRTSQEGTLKAHSDDDGPKVISGYALKFGTRSHNLGGFIEMIDKRALDQTDMSDVRALIDHDPSKILGRTSAGTLKLEVDDIGLRFDVTLPNTQYASDLYENLRVGNISNCSFGFMLGKDGDSFTRDQETGLPLRSLRNISKLTDVSVVTYPAYEDTDVTIAKRNLQQYEERNRNPEKEKLLLQLDLLKMGL
ncbi:MULTISPECIES: HK97 family phage prohead protease [Bacillus]|uniref:HK97 family phage prohead protease n=1 Tax=Bacillus TaxID=1386 RepID=UPI0001CE3963|nr:MULTISPECIES: HK97 family phage prohead protease [Bacillus]MCY7923977.1 HK97 family phage prohead protease [Bacillus spizizenii]AMK72397.1 peptidase U35 [Bacillus subtilis subsp. natto]API42094.1 peptidase U35 [Bacillus subtilis]API94850.1 peptidase U35 [Bacillus subtilis]ARI88410.1 peptidase U35 [Bacillus subtilis]